MTTQAVMLAYILAVALAVFALYWCGTAKWYWHVLSFAAAIAIGLMPPVQGWTGPIYDMAIGSAFLFLLVWGVGEPVYNALHLPHHHSRRHV